MSQAGHAVVHGHQKASVKVASGQLECLFSVAMLAVQDFLCHQSRKTSGWAVALQIQVLVRTCVHTRLFLLLKLAIIHLLGSFECQMP